MLEALEERRRSGRPLRMGLIGAGTFGTMLLGQALRLPGLVVAGVADRDPARARAALARVGAAEGDVPVTDDAGALIAAPGMEVVVEATGAPAAGIAHALEAIRLGRHVVMVNVEADALAGPLLAHRARAAGVVYSLAYGDQPALVCDLVDWARAAGFEVVCAGKGTRYLPSYHAATPDTVWDHYGLPPERVTAGGFNARMFTSFLDGTKSAIEMAAIANATGLEPQADGLRFPPCGAGRLAEVCVPVEDGGELARAGTVEVVSSLERDGSAVADDLRWGVYVTFAAGSDHAARCLVDYGVQTSPSGRHGALYRPYHLIGLETTVSVLSAGLLGEPTGAPRSFRADVVAVAKRDLTAGERLDGEGGFTVWGALAPAARSLASRALPIGLAHDARLVRPVAAGATVGWDDVDGVVDDGALSARREMERLVADAGAGG
jgi:predicted homoserine dehydrogenase-like protein